jgi:hypothetical protein
LQEFPALTVDDVRRLADDFRDYWIGVPGAKGLKLDWLATWRNSIRMKAPRATARGSPSSRKPADNLPTFDDLAEFYDAQAKRESGDSPGTLPLLQNLSKH